MADTAFFRKGQSRDHQNDVRLTGKRLEDSLEQQTASQHQEGNGSRDAPPQSEVRGQGHGVFRVAIAILTKKKNNVTHLIK